MNNSLKDRLGKKIKDEMSRNEEELKLIDTNLSLLQKKQQHIKQMRDDWEEILNELMNS
jgi:uncharacterized protein HemX